MNTRNHANRSKRNPSPSRNPQPQEIRNARERAGLTQTQAGALVHVSLHTWQKWETEKGHENHRRMPPAAWELFNIKVKADTS